MKIGPLVLCLMLAFFVTAEASARPVCWSKRYKPNDWPENGAPKFDGPHSIVYAGPSSTRTNTGAVFGARIPVLASLDPGFTRVCGKRYGNQAQIDITLLDGTSLSQDLHKNQCLDSEATKVSIFHGCEAGTVCEEVPLYALSSCPPHDPKVPFVSMTVRHTLWAVVENDLNNLKGKRAAYLFDAKDTWNAIFVGHQDRQVEVCHAGAPGSIPAPGVFIGASSSPTAAPTTKVIELTGQCVYATGKSVWLKSTRLPASVQHRLVK